ncbi:MULTISPECIES: OprD family outer membrane porin [unclassified Pseudomonas]|uniref:OprD family outer membrane porin n=1 Tax=unclassified Pseudomonas TaxID=196821 RepID=UPI0025D5E118|nr:MULTISPECIES: OprD family outer membrane porin [unclassified Pseudomonas]
MKVLNSSLLMCGGFILPYAQGDMMSDSAANLTARNYYINQDFRSHGSSPRQEEWGQAFILDYRSGYSDGPVGIGVDALGMLGIRLDSGGSATKADRTRTPGAIFPLDSDNHAEDEFSHLGLTAKARFAKSELRWGTLLPRVPVVARNDGRLLPQTFEGVQLTSKDLDGLSLIGGVFEHAKGRNSSDNRSLSITGAGKVAGPDKVRRSNKFYYAGFDYALNKNWIGQYYYGTLKDFYRQQFLGLIYTRPLSVGSLQTTLQYFNSTGDGKNTREAGRAEGYTSTGYYHGAAAGEVDNRTWSSLLSYRIGGHKFGLGYQKSTGKSNMPFLNQGDGASAWLMTGGLIWNFTRAGERSQLAQYDYDFAASGLPGLNATLIYIKGSHIYAHGAHQKEWARDLRLSYTVQGGPLKYFSIGWYYGVIRGNTTTVLAGDVDHQRLFINYKLPIF